MAFAQHVSVRERFLQFWVTDELNGGLESCALTWTLSFELEGIPMLITHPLFISLFLVPNRSLRLSKHETRLFVCVFLMEVFKFRSIRLLGVGTDQIVRVLPY